MLHLYGWWTNEAIVVIGAASQHHSQVQPDIGFYAVRWTVNLSHFHVLIPHHPVFKVVGRKSC